MRCARAVRMSRGGESAIKSVGLEVRRVRWRYVKGGLRIMVLLLAGGGLVADCATCDGGGGGAVAVDIVGARVNS